MSIIKYSPIICIIPVMILLHRSRKKSLLNDYKKPIIYITGSIIILSIFIPLALEYFIYRNEIYSSISNEGLASFLASFLGGMISSGITLITMYISINEARKDMRRDEKLRNRSFLDIFSQISTKGKLEDIKDSYDKAKVLLTKEYKEVISKRPEIIMTNKGIRFIGIKNCGPTIIKDIKLETLDINNRKNVIYLNRLLVDEIFFIPIIPKDYKDINCFIRDVNVYYSTMSNEIIEVKKKFNRDYSYEEEIMYHDKLDYSFKRKMFGWRYLK